MRIAAVDLISNTCFPLLAADELGLFKAEGLHVEIDLLPMLRGTQALHNGTVDLLAAGSVYDGRDPRSLSRSHREHRGFW
jgi:hypothetical protein